MIAERIARAVDGLDETAVHAKPEWAEFSIAANICHLRDIEAEGWNVRARRMAEEDDPFLPDVDGAKLQRALEQIRQPALKQVLLGELHHKILRQRRPVDRP